MTNIQIDSIYETFRDRFIVREYKSKNYENGSSVKTVEVRSYSLLLYANDGRLEQHSSKGDNIDLKV